MKPWEIVRCVKEPMQVDSTWGSTAGVYMGKLGRAQELLGAPREIPGGSPCPKFSYLNEGQM